MTDYRSLFDREHIAAFDLMGKDVTVTIVKVEGKKLKSQRGENLKPVLTFDGKDKTMVANKTNARTIAGMYGNEVEAWVGKRVTLYATTTASPDGTVDCIRIRVTIPKNGK